MPSSEFGQLAKTAGDRDFGDRVGAEIFQRAAGKISHIQYGGGLKPIKFGRSFFRGFAGTGRDMGDVGRAGNIDALMDGGDPGRAGIGDNDAGGA